MKDGFIPVAVATPEVEVANCAKNAAATVQLVEEAAARGVKLLVLPELGLTAYTCGDLFLQPTLLRGAEAALAAVLDATRGKELLVAVGLPVAVQQTLYNCAAILHDGKVLGVVPKVHVPNYSEFYEKRHFAPAPAETLEIVLCGQTVPFGAKLLFACRELPDFVLGVEICEDLWVPDPPSNRLALAGATVIANLSASNEVLCKAPYRRQLVAGQSARLSAAYLYACAGDGESTTDLVFSGHDLIAENGTVLAEQRFETGLIATEIDVSRLVQERRRMQNFPAHASGFETVFFSWHLTKTPLTRPISPMPFVPDDPEHRAATCEEILTLAAWGLKKRLKHTGAKTAVLGLSGGLDSTLALLITARAFDLLGRDHREILAVTMPCFGTTDRTLQNALTLAERLGASIRTVSIGETVKRHFMDIGQSMDDHDVTFENGQARERTQVLMDLANKHGGLVIGTGDLSELALGWATYNGDHMSMYGVNGSIPKTLVRHLVDYAAHETKDAALTQVLLDILDTPVSPELLPAVDGDIAQKTEDLVGPYTLHDFFLYYAIRWAFPPSKVYRLAQYALGDQFDNATIFHWLETFYRRFFAQQFKRSCLPDGPKVGTVTLSPRGDWRMPSDAVRALWQEDLKHCQAGEARP